MLQSMHDKIQGIVAWVVAIVIALAFSLWGIQNYLHGGSSQLIAKVNGKKITQQEFRMAYEQAKRNELLQHGPNFSFDQKNQAQLKKRVLDSLVNQEVIFQAENKMGLGVSKRILWSIVAGIPVFQVNGHFSISNFQRIVQRLFYSEQAFFENMEQGILRLQLERGIAESGFALPYEGEVLKKLSAQRRDFGYFEVPFERFTKSIQLTPTEIQKYYESQQKRFLLPEKVSIQYLELSSADIVKSTPTSLQLKQFYQSHIDAFSTPKKWQATKVLWPLGPKVDNKTIENAKKKMEEFTKALRENKTLSNTDPNVRVTTSWLSRNEILPEIATRLNKLEIGQVSAPILGKDGLQIFKIIAKEEPKISPFEQVVVKVKSMYEHDQITHEFTQAADKLSDLVYTNPDHLEPAAKELGLKIKETGLFTREGIKEGVLANPKVVKTAFSDVVLKQRYNSSLIEVGTGKVMVLRIKEYIPEKTQSLDEVRAKLTEELRQNKAQELAKSLANKLLLAMNEGKTTSELAREHGLAWREVQAAKYEHNDPLIEHAFGLEKAKNLDTVVFHLANKELVLRLNRIYEDNSTKTDSKTENYIKVLPKIHGYFDYQTFVSTLMEQAKIEMFDQTERGQSEIYE